MGRKKKLGKFGGNILLVTNYSESLFNQSKKAFASGCWSKFMVTFLSFGS